jgi:hypothetical protein
MSKDFKIHTDYELIKASGAAPQNDPAFPHAQWIAAAKEGQVIKLEDDLGTITKEALESSVGSWSNGIIFDNHKTINAGFRIHGDKFISPYLYFLLDNVIVAHLDKSAGGSIDALATKLNGNKVTGLQGVGYSVLSPGLTPSCTKEAGCGIPIAGEVEIADIDAEWDFKKEDYSLEQLETASAWKNIEKSEGDRTKEDYKLAYKAPDGKVVWRGTHAAMSALNDTREDVNVSRKDRETVYNILKAAYKLFDKEPPELKQNIEGELKDKGGSKKKMAEEKSEVVYTAKQVADIKAAAVADVTEQLGNAQKVAVSDMETAQAAELKTLGETHATELVTQRELVAKQVGMIESLAAQYSLSDEAKKELTDAKTVKDTLALFAGLKITKPIAGKGAAEGSDKKDEKGGGIIEGASKIEGAAPKTVKVEEVGNYDAITGKYIPTYREELI